MLVFLDTEFTDFVSADLISIALVSEDGQEFYAERTDYHRDACSDFVREHVLPVLGRVPGASCSRHELTSRLCAWFEQLPEPATIVFDFQGDWLLLMRHVLGKTQGGPPYNFGNPLQLDNSNITDPIFEQAQSLVYTDEFPRHHALADARALMTGYRVWRESVEKTWGGVMNDKRRCQNLAAPF